MTLNLREHDVLRASQLGFTPIRETPRHVAIIMDGNGRWATTRRLPRTAGHQAGVQAVREVVKSCVDLGIQMLTLYTFSSENWGRPKGEVDTLMQLCESYAQHEVASLHSQGVRVKIVGRRSGLPPALLDSLDRLEGETSGGTRLALNLAINYGGRAEIVDATRALVRAIQQGEIDAGEFDEDTFERFLYTAGQPSPEIVIRTAGEQRTSNFLLWQAANSFFWSTPVYWPDFGQKHLHEAMIAWQVNHPQYWP